MVEGPFELAEPDGSSVTYGNFADLSLNKADGIMLAVKHVVEEYLEVNASEVDRDGERYSNLKLFVHLLVKFVRRKILLFGS